jgi:hypothetical protein
LVTKRADGGATLRRWLLAITGFLIAWAAGVQISGGIRVDLVGVAISSRNPLRALGLAGIGALVYAAISTSLQRRQDWGWVTRVSVRRSMLVLALAILVLGLERSTYVAGGSDSSGYVSQAALWLRGDLRVEQPFVRDFAWPDAARAFAPLGYRITDDRRSIVPTYSAGLPILMAGGQLLFGACGAFFVVPLSGALAVFLCWVLGRQTVSPATGAAAAVLLATSPEFLQQLVSPMSDVPVTAFWLAAWILALQFGAGTALASGLACSMALLIRPNLAPLACVLGLAVALVTPGSVDKFKRVIAFVAGVIPGVVSIAAINWYLYGSPLMSGYGTVATIYKVEYIRTNLGRYSSWLLTAHGPFVLLGLLALVPSARLFPDTPRQRTVRWCLLLFVLTLFASYLVYEPFSHWSYLRFLLPGLPLMLLLTLWSGRELLRPMSRLVRGFVATMAVALLVAYHWHFVREQGIAELRLHEQRYSDVGHFAAIIAPANAIFLSMQHSGSLRHYTNQPIVRYDLLRSDLLDEVLRSLRDRGWHPLIVLDKWEESEFRRKFGSDSRIGRLDWLPVAEWLGSMPVRVYDPGDADSHSSRTPHPIPAAPRCHQ